MRWRLTWKATSRSAKEARGNNNRADVETFTEAGERISKLIAKIRAKLD
jgi:hypothetical protein